MQLPIIRLVTYDTQFDKCVRNELKVEGLDKIWDWDDALRKVKCEFEGEFLVHMENIEREISFSNDFWHATKRSAAFGSIDW